MSKVMNIEAEEAAFQAEVAAVKEWWKSPRWRYTKRPFTAEAIVAKRGNLKIQYPSNVQAKKLWDIVEDKWMVCPASPSHLSSPSQACGLG